MPDFSNRITRSLSDKLGEQPSVLDFIPEAQHAAVRAGTASANLTSAIQSGLNAVGSAGGGILYLPWGVYPVLDLTVPANVVLRGDGTARSILKRFGNLPAGRGVLNFSAAKSGCAELAIDGQVTTPATAIYSSLSDPSASSLVANSSIRIHPGASDITLFRCRIFHTGGYAVHIDARTAHVNRVRIIEPDLHDNRSFLFGATAGSEIYGSWTGGILAQGDGLTNNFAVRGLTVRDGRFRRGTGNQVWSHLYGFGALHSDFKIQGCTFEDIGRDGIMMGGVVGGDVAGNFFRRIGYVCTDDVSAGAPRWINGQWAVGLDTAGLTRGVNYRGNSFVSCYGAAMDLDGFAEGVVSDNTVIVPTVGEPEYTEDAIASWAGNYCYGAQTSNTNNLADAAVGVRVTGNRFRNCGLGAVRMYASRRGAVCGNTIEHAAGAAIAPIILGNIGSGANQRAYANTVTDNDIHYSPASPVGVVQEDANGFNFQAGDVNRVFGNRLHGANLFEFFKHSTSGSRTAQEFASVKSALTAESKNVLQREDGYWRTYWVEGGVSKVVSTLIDRVPLPAAAFGGPLHNVSVDGVGGVFSTGARTTSAFDDAMLSSKVYADGFLALAATTFATAEANLLADTVGLIRYNATTKAFEQSTSASAGARVWTPFEPSRWSLLGADIYRSSGRVTIGSSLPGSLLTLRANTDDGLTVTNNTQTGVYFVSSYGGPTIGSTTSHPLVFLTNNAARGRITDAGNWLVGANTDDASGARLQIAGFARATIGFATPSTNTDAIQATAGGVTARFLIGTRSLTLVGDTAANAGVSGLGQGRLYFDSTANRFRISENGGAFQDLTGAGVTSLTGTANQVSVSGATGAVTLSLPQSIHADAIPQFAGLGIGAAASGLPLLVFGHSSSEVARFQGRSDISDNRNFVSFYTTNPGFWWELSNQDPSGGGSLNGFAFRERSGAGLSVARLFMAQGGNVMVGTTTDDTSGARFQVSGFIRATTGYATPSTATDSIQAPSGGVTARFLIGTRSLTLTADTEANAGLAGAAQGRLYFDSATNRFRISENGGAYVNLTGAGVTSLTGTANQVNVSASTGGVTLSLPQNIHSGASPTFSGLSLSGVLYSTGSVGINAPSPQFALDIRRTGSPGNTLILQTLFNTESSYQANSGSALLFQYGGGHTQAMISAHIENSFNGNNGYLSLRTTTDGGATLPERVRITAAGNVLVNATTDDGSGARLQVNGFIRPITGLATPSANTDAIQAPNGGVTARFLIGTRSLTLTADAAANAGLSGSAQGRIYFDSGTNKFRVSENGSAYVDLLSATGVTSLTGTANQVNVSAATGAVTLSLPQSIHAGAIPQFAGLGIGAAASGLPLLVFGHSSSEVARFQGRSDISDNRNFVSFYTTNPDFWWELSNQDSSGGGTTNGLAFRERSGAGLSVARLFMAQGGNVMVGTTTDDTSGARFQVSGFIRATTGYATPSTATDSIQAPSGGVTARFLIGTRSLTMTADSAANAGLSGSAQGRIYFDSSTNKFRVSENGGAYVDLLSATGVTSLTGTANQVNVSASTGAVTLSLPQNIHTGASPTFAGVTAGAFSATATGTAIGFQTSNFNFQVNGNGVVSSAGGINVAGATVIDSSRNATNLASATAAGVFQSQASGSSIAFQTTNFNFQVNGNGVVSSAGGINVSGVTCINTSRQFVGYGVDVSSYGVSAGGYSVFGGYVGQTWNVVGTFTINGTPYTTLVFRGGILVSAF